MMPTSGHPTDPVTVAAGIDSLADSLSGNLQERALTGQLTRRRIAAVLKTEAKLRVIMNHLAAINGGNPDFDRVHTSFRAHDAELVQAATVLSKLLRRR